MAARGALRARGAASEASLPRAAGAGLVRRAFREHAREAAGPAALLDVAPGVTQFQGQTVERVVTGPGTCDAETAWLGKVEPYASVRSGLALEKGAIPLIVHRFLRSDRARVSLC